MVIIFVLDKFTFSNQPAGDIAISTKQLVLQDGSVISAATFGRGLAGNVIVNSEQIYITGFLPGSDSSGINASTRNAGNAGNVTINTRDLKIENGGAVSASGFTTGSAGNVRINASESIEVSGSPTGRSPSQIRSAMTRPTSLGNAGNVNIHTPFLRVTDGARIGVYNEGEGNAGMLDIKANSILLDNRGSLSAETRTSNDANKGSISVQANNLVLRRSSAITTKAGEMGNGGNIRLDVGAVALLEASKINADAGKGKGGNISISTEGLFKSSGSTITSTSGIGIDGNINISNPSIKKDSTLQEQSSNFVTTENLVASNCLAQRNKVQGRFIVTGNGGLAETPANSVELPYFLVEVRPTSGYNITQEINKKDTNISRSKWQLGDPIQEATHLTKTDDGRVLLEGNFPGDTVSFLYYCSN